MRTTSKLPPPPNSRVSDPIAGAITDLAGISGAMASVILAGANRFGGLYVLMPGTTIRTGSRAAHEESQGWLGETHP